MIVLLSSLMFSASVYAEQGGDMKQGQMMPQKGMNMDHQGSMPQQGMMMKMDSSMPMPMTGQMKEMMMSMIDMMKMQQKILKGVKPGEKKAMLTQMDKKMEKMEMMMAYMPCMDNSPSGQKNDQGK